MKGAARILGVTAILAVFVLSSQVIADTITFGGEITQSTSDGTGPAMNNPALNDIQDGDNFLVTLTFTGSITAPGTYPLPGAMLVFLDTDASVTEDEFASTSLSVTQDGTSYDLSLLGCLTTGSGCLVGNYLSANFSIPDSDLNSMNVTAQSIADLNPPLDLLEDDGVTDIQGSISSYSYSGATATPEPSQMIPLAIGLAALLIGRRNLRGRA